MHIPTVKIIFVNGKIGGGSPPKGALYWGGGNSLFVQKAKAYFGATSIYFTNEDYGLFSSTHKRRSNGHRYAKNNFESITENMDASRLHFKMITHSMGAAYGEGIVDCLKLNGYSVTETIHLNPFQAAAIECNKDKVNGLGTHIIDFQNINDPIINNPFRSNPGDIKNADKKIRIKAFHKWMYIHRSPISYPEDFWSLLRAYL